MKNMLKRLTDNYRKDPGSNIGRLFAIIAGEVTELQDTLQQKRDWIDIDEARGAGLDRLGVNIEQARGKATDEVYRIMLKSKIARNLSTGDINTIIKVLAVALNTEPEEITVEEMYADPLEPEPACIKILQMPLKQVNEAGMSPRQFGRIVQRTVAAGVRVGMIELTGTFEFGDELAVDNGRGFSDEQQEIGGYFGYAYEPGAVDDLPL